MAEINDGGPAFPVWETGGNGPEPTGTGASLRDLFAMASLMGTRANAKYGNCVPEMAADMAYKDADAMLAEREKKHE